MHRFRQSYSVLCKFQNNLVKESFSLVLNMLYVVEENLVLSYGAGELTEKNYNLIGYMVKYMHNMVSWYHIMARCS